MTEPLFSLAYVSRSAIEDGPEPLRADIDHILAIARHKNAKHAVTGALLFSGGCFAQLLEGPRSAVESIFESIRCDPRHRELTLLHRHAIDQRAFAAWAMVFVGVDIASIDPTLATRGAAPSHGILATSAGQGLLAALRTRVRRDKTPDP